VNITFECRDIFQPVRLSKPFDIVISNPPYVMRSEMAGMRKNVLEHEPHQALFVKDDPLEYYQAIIDHDEKLVHTGGKFYFEINEAFGNEIEGFFHKSGLRSVRIIKDLHGKNRFACAEAP
jgi:release factor glutamine methyltransferase